MKPPVTPYEMALWALGWVNFWEEFFPDAVPITARTFPG